METPFRIEIVGWQDAAALLRTVRLSVFVYEQGVPESLEWDAHDADAIHALAVDADGAPIGTGRLTVHPPLGHIGRMAVLKPWRGRGVGSAVLARLLAEARARGITRVVLNAQTHALPFYRRHGFVAEGQEFVDAGIPHYRMTRVL